MAFSNSSIKTYEQCPYKYKLTRIEHKQEPSGDAANRGKMIHSEFEDALTKLMLIPDERKGWVPYLDTLVGKNTQAEVEFAVTKDWQACDFKDPMAWLRGIIDALYFQGTAAHILDWKTGKERDYEDQLKLYAAAVLTIYPKVEQVSMEICYIDLNKHVNHGIMLREHLPDMQAWVDNRITKIERDDIFAPKPSLGCKWCHFRKSNGGPCQW